MNREMIDDMWLFVAICLIALLSGLIHSAIGFGFGIVAISLMPLVMDARSAHIVISTASIPVLIGAAWAYRDGFDWLALRQALCGALVGIPLGLFAFQWVSIQWLVRATGLAILLMVWMSFRNRRIKAERSTQPYASFVAGSVAGFLAGAVSIAGPPVAAFALRQGWPQARFKAFVNQFLLVVAAFKVAGLGILGLLNAEVMIQSASIAPFAIVGIALGAGVSRRLSAVWFERIVAAVLVGLAIMFLF